MLFVIFHLGIGLNLWVYLTLFLWVSRQVVLKKYTAQSLHTIAVQVEPIIRFSISLNIFDTHTAVDNHMGLDVVLPLPASLSLPTQY